MKRRFPKAPYLGALCGIGVLALSPLFAGIVAETGAALAGCVLHVGRSEDCVMLGRKLGGTLYAIGMLTWLTPLGLMFGAIAFCIRTLFLVVHFIVWRARG